MSLIQSAPYALMSQADDVVDVVRGVGEIGREERRLVGREIVGVAVTAGERDTAAGGDDAGPGDQALGDSIAEGELGIGGICLAGVADGGKSVVEPDLEIGYSADGCFSGRRGEKSVGGLGVGVVESVSVSVDQAGNEGELAHVHDTDSGGRAGSDRDDAFAGDKNVGVVGDLAAADVDEPAGVDGDLFRRRLLRGSLTTGQENAGDEKDQRLNFAQARTPRDMRAIVPLEILRVCRAPAAIRLRLLAGLDLSSASGLQRSRVVSIEGGKSLELVLCEFGWVLHEEPLNSLGAWGHGD